MLCALFLAALTVLRGAPSPEADYSAAVFSDVAALAGEAVEFVEGEPKDHPEADALVCAPRNLELLRLYDFPIQPMCRVGGTNYYFAVKKNHGDVLDRLKFAYRDLIVSNQSGIDALRLKFLGEAAPTNRLRIAAYRRGGLLIINELGERSGLIPDTVAALERVGNFTVEWVYGGFDDSIKDVEDGKLDFTGGIVHNYNRRQKVDYLHLKMGLLQAYLWTHPGNGAEPYAPSTWNGLKIGYLAGTNSARLLREMLERDGVEAELVAYRSSLDVLNAYRRGEITAAYDLERPEYSDEATIYSERGRAMYFVSTRANRGVTALLEEALDNLVSEDPAFFDNAYSAHFVKGRGSAINFSLPERRYIEHLVETGETVLIDMSPLVISSYDAERFRPTGFIASLFELFHERTGIHFSSPLPTDAETALRKYRDGETDLWAPYPLHPSYGDGVRDVVFSFPVPQVLISRSGAPIDIVERGKIAVVEGDERRIQAYSRPGVLDRMVYAADELSAIRMVADGEVDFTVLNVDVGRELVFANRLDGRLEMKNLVHSSYEDSYEICAGPKLDPILKSIVRKAAGSIDQTEVRELYLRSVLEHENSKRLFGLSPEELRARLFSYAAFIAFAIVIVLGFLITMLKSSLARARRSEADAKELAAVKTRFLATMSHELRTPLNAVLGFAEHLATDPDVKGESRELVDGISTSGKALLSLINDILDLSKADAGAVEWRNGTCNLKRFCHEMQALFSESARKKGLVFSAVAQGNVDFVGISPRALRQVVINLVGNAIKYTDTGRVAIHMKWEAGTLSFTVSDSGIGMTKAHLEKLFKPFEQDIASRLASGHGNTQGTGLGLAIVKRMVDSAGGTVECSSTLGFGTVFRVEIPRVEGVLIDKDESEEAEAAKPVAKGPSMLERLRPCAVLIVDDVAMNRKIVSLHLKKLGFVDIVEACDGKAALEELSKRDFALVLSDVWMPIMNGPELAKAIRADAKLKSLKLIAITADVASSDSFDVSAFDAVALKPVSLDKLASAIDSLK